LVRGDIAPITIGAATNIQDGAILHVGKRYPCVIGDRVTIGHGAIVHGATVEDDVMIAMGARVLNGAVIGRRSIVGAGAVVTEGVVIPPGSIVIGIPARVARSISPEQLRQVLEAAQNYVQYARAQTPAGSRKRLPGGSSKRPISRKNPR
jgi:carbonic anhydrase/acetyltransferase-like protein (isoleucine patch superfamily)